ncbi:MAG: sulfatase-like hydrolase/transferase [Bryobacteraceae bacterium]
MMTRRRLLTAALQARPEPQNTILILADDLGFGDLGCYGSTAGTTPHLDRLAADGARLTGHYTCSPVCSPARAGLLTGLVPDRTGVTGVLRDPDDHRGLDLNLATVATHLKRKGLATALIGKWHLGMPAPYQPRQRGFDYFWGFLNGTIDYETHLSLGGGGKGSRTTYENEKPIALRGYFPELAASKAVEYVESNRNRSYFLYLPLALPHTPLQVPDRWSDPFLREGISAPQALYRGMLRCLDDGIGRLRAALERTGQWDRTRVIFVSDHGWVKKRDPADAGSNGELRGGKYELWEGGIRVPCVVRWPGLTRRGSTIDAVSWFPDWLPTLTGAQSRDGIDLRPALSGGTVPERDLCWRFEDRLVKTPLSFAIRRGQWKLLRIGESRALYNLIQDPGERKDASASHPEVAADLETRLRLWQSGLPHP